MSALDKLLNLKQWDGSCSSIRSRSIRAKALEDAAAELAELRRRVEDAELIALSFFHGPEGMWIRGPAPEWTGWILTDSEDDEYQCGCAPSDLPILTDEARAALRKELR